MDLKIEALKKRYEAKIAENIATLDVYRNNSMGIGEHPQIIDEMDNMISQIADYEGRIQVLGNLNNK
jgi:hypothetical protein